MHSQDLINAIKTRRDNLDVTQEILADLSGVGLRTLKKFESGKGNPTLETLNKLGNALGMELVFTVKNLNNKP
ncbi:helix-turn-helix domain-containing protein [Polaribacter atrinae]|uniref:helix-turn-helix domain-containing protein n=1 Tax=Polaribacter atrinae TaxID=1333662 RepID=UPI0030FC04FE